MYEPDCCQRQASDKGRRHVTTKGIEAFVNATALALGSQTIRANLGVPEATRAAALLEGLKQRFLTLSDSHMRAD